MQIKVSFAISGGIAESDALPLLTLEVDAQPSIETLGLGLADAKALLARVQAQISVPRHHLQNICADSGFLRYIMKKPLSQRPSPPGLTPVDPCSHRNHVRASAWPRRALFPR